MAEILIKVDIPDEMVQRVREYYESPDGEEADDLLWEDTETAVIDAIRATFTPHVIWEQVR